MQCTLCIVQCVVAVYSVQWPVFIVQFDVCSVKCVLFSVHSAVCSKQFVLGSVQC